MQQEAPLHSSPHNRSFFQMVNFYIAIGVVIFGVWTGDLFLGSLGLLVGVLFWFTTPRHYYVMPDRLVVLYGRPRTVIVPYDTVFDVNIVRVPMASGIFVRRIRKAGVIIRPRDMEGFMAELSRAMIAAGYTPPPEAPPDDVDAAPDAPLPPVDDIRNADSEPETDAPPSGR